MYDGGWFEEGDGFPASDGCNTWSVSTFVRHFHLVQHCVNHFVLGGYSTCESGNIVCTSDDCPPIHVEVPEMPRRSVPDEEGEVT